MALSSHCLKRKEKKAAADLKHGARNETKNFSPLPCFTSDTKITNKNARAPLSQAQQAHVAVSHDVVQIQLLHFAVCVADSGFGSAWRHSDNFDKVPQLVVGPVELVWCVWGVW